MGFNQMITNEELSAIVDNYCRQIRKICDEAIYAKNDEVIEKVTKISKIAARINEIKSIQKSAKDNRREMMEKLRNKNKIEGWTEGKAYRIEELCGEDEE